MSMFSFQPAHIEAERTFTTYSNYLLHISNSIKGIYGMDDDLHFGLVQAMRAHQPVRKVQRRSLSTADESRVTQALRLSWATESQLRLRGQHDPELLPDLLHGAASEAYYAVYHSARAFFIAGGFSVQSNHASVLNQLSTVVAQRKLLLPPWSVYVAGGPTKNHFQTSGLPVCIPKPSYVSNLARVAPDAVWDSLAKGLRTTRERQLKERRDDWCVKAKRKRLPAEQAKRIAESTPPTTLFNFLWRLRKRSDYRDVDIFLDGISSPNQALNYHSSMEGLVAGTLTVLNTLTVAYAGAAIYEQIISPFLRRKGEVYNVAHVRDAALMAPATTT